MLKRQRFRKTAKNGLHGSREPGIGKSHHPWQRRSSAFDFAAQRQNQALLQERFDKRSCTELRPCRFREHQNELLTQAARAVEVFDDRLRQIREESAHTNSFKVNVAARGYNSARPVTGLNGWNTLDQQGRAQSASRGSRFLFCCMGADAVHQVGRHHHKTVLSNSDCPFLIQAQHAFPGEAIVNARGRGGFECHLMAQPDIAAGKCPNSYFKPGQQPLQNIQIAPSFRRPGRINTNSGPLRTTNFLL